MRTILLAAILSLAVADTGTAQTGAAPPAPLRLSVNDAVAMALEHNTDLRVDRLDPGISDARIAAALGAFRPFVNGGIQRNNQLQPPTSFLIPIPTRTDVVTTSAGVGQRLSWFGTSYNVAWNTTHTNSDSVLNSFNPLVQSGLSVSVSQPLLRDLFIDQSRQQLATSRIARDIADTRLRESLVHLTANVKTAYWNLVSAIATVEARQSALDLARELVRVNTAKVNVGQSPALDLVSAQAEVASDEEQLIIARTAVQQNEDRLRLLIYDPAQPEMWTVPIVPVDAPPIATVTPDVNAAVMTALKERADLQRARKDIETAAINTRFAANTRLPDVRLNGSYLANGLGGT
ncbi:MAG: TolC family protein, partial [Acidobacteriota bacterium]